MNIGDLIRKIVSFALLAASAITLVAFFMGVGTIVFDPFKAAFDPFNFSLLGEAIYKFMEAISLPLIMFILGLIGLTLDSSNS